jgi:hypothetical protein
VAYISAGLIIENFKRVSQATGYFYVWRCIICIVSYDIAVEHLALMNYEYKIRTQVVSIVGLKLEACTNQNRFLASLNYIKGEYKIYVFKFKH